MLAGMTAFTLTAAQIKKVDGVMIRWLRSVMEGEAHWIAEQGRHRTLTNAQVLQHWKLATCITELGVRRPRKHQQWARRPNDFRRVRAAVFGQAWWRRSAGYAQTVIFWKDQHHGLGS